MKTNRQDPYQKAQKTALSLLARRCHSRDELRRKLAARGFEAAVIERVLAACERLDYINDEMAASLFVEELVRKQVGLLRVQKEMNNRGFALDLINRMIDEHNLRDRELELAKRAMGKKSPTLIREKDPRKRREKLVRFLRSRGFRPSTISALFGRFGPDAESPQGDCK